MTTPSTSIQAHTTPRLKRTTLTTSRSLDFCSEKELVAQTGHRKEDWPLVVLKGLMDNALDACEDTEIAPEIAVTVEDGYRRTLEIRLLESAIDVATDEVRAEMTEAIIPDDLDDQVGAHLEEHPTSSWDEAVAEIAGGS